MASQARKAIWLAVNPHTGKRRIDEAFPLEIRKRTNDNEMFIEFKSGAMWHVVGSDNYNSLVGSPPKGVVFSEWALADPAAWAYLSPILAENGGWALFIFTPRGENHGYSIHQRAQESDAWFSQTVTVEDTDVFTDKQLEEERQTSISLYGKDEGEAFHQQEYYCSFQAPILGAYYNHEITKAQKEKRFGSVPHESGVPVHTAWDLGSTDPTAIWFFQVINRQVRIVDYYEDSGAVIDHYVKTLQDKPYIYGTHLMPHDAFDGRYKLATGKTLAESAEKLGLRDIKEVPKSDIQAGINEVRQILGRCHFDKEKCENGINALKNYRKEWIEKRLGWATKPLHDWSSHGADAFRYLAVGMDLIAPNIKPKTKHRAPRSKSRQRVSHIA